MPRKQGWFNPNPGCGASKKKNSHTAGKTKGDSCQKTENKVKLCKARAHVRFPKLFSQWYTIFPECQH